MSDDGSIHDLTGFSSPGPSSQNLTPSKQKSSLLKTVTRINLQKSIQLLDDAAGPPIGVGDSPSFLGRSPRTSRLTPKSMSFSRLGSRIPGSSLKRPATPLGINLSFNETLFQPSPGSPSSMENAFDDVTTTNFGLLLQEEPELAACTGVYSDFQQAFAAHFSPQQVFDLLRQYENICSEQLQLLKQLIMRAAPNQLKYNKKLDVYNLLYSERCTWQLLISLFGDRLEDSPMEEDDKDNNSISLKYLSDNNIMSALFKRDPTVREAQIVVDWLESCSRENLSTLAENPKFYAGQAVAWENTLHQLQKKSRLQTKSMERPLVDEMDPDAPSRQGRVLDDLDQDDELLLLQRMFACIRAGDLDQAQEICTNYGQSWRAATLEGWRLYHDANFESLTSHEELQPVEGNLYRDVWKRVSWAMSQESKYNIFEKAIYAAFSGNLQVLLPVCRSWSDHVWAYFRTYVDQMVEQEVRMLSNRKMEELPKNYFEKTLDPESIFCEIEASEDAEIRKESNIWFNLIQKYIILDNLNGLVDIMYDWLENDNLLPPHLIRFMAHLILVINSIGVNVKEEKCNAILQGYVDLLVKDKQTRLVATYVATLPKHWQPSAYAQFLEGIEEKEERRMYLELAKEAGLDVAIITKTVVENIRKKDDVDLKTQLRDNASTIISKEDEQKIQAIDWLVFDQSQRAEAIKQANAVMRGFLAMNKPTAARQVFEKLPSDSVAVVTQTWYRKFGSKELGPDEDNAVREYHCIKACLDAIESFNDWFDVYNHSKPTAPERPEGANFKDRMAHDHEMKQHEAEMDRWKHGLTMQTKTTKSRIYNVLLFPDGGWMVDRFENTVIDESRCHQMKLLRQLCLPNFVVQLHQILNATEQYSECMQLAELVTDAKNGLHQVFSRDDLQQILKLLRKSALVLINQKRDPFGYEDPMSYEMEMPAT